MHPCSIGKYAFVVSIYIHVCVWDCCVMRCHGRFFRRACRRRRRPIICVWCLCTPTTTIASYDMHIYIVPSPVRISLFTQVSPPRGCRSQVCVCVWVGAHDHNYPLTWI